MFSADKTDELNCPAQSCLPSEFRCKLTGICITRGFLCDQEVDCSVTVDGVLDTSDEQENCDSAAICPPNEHLCADGFNCVELRKFCDGIPDCPDRSDEGSFCLRNSAECKHCAYGCSQTPEGPQCYCGKGQKLTKTSTAAVLKCEDADECQLETTCEQLCTNTPGSFSCSCVDGYMEDSTASCKGINEPVSEPPTILLANGDKMMQFEMNLTKSVRFSSGKHITTVDFDHRNKTACWIVQREVKRSQDRLKSVKMVVEEMVLRCAPIENLQQHWDFIAEYSLEGVVQIAKDWVSGNWYFADEHYDRMFVCNWNLSICHNILPCYECNSHSIAPELDKPSDFALDPSVGFIFITDWSQSQPSLSRIDMTGENYKHLVTKKIIQPFGVTLDLPRQRVYWLDNFLEYINSVDYNGDKRTIVKEGHDIKSLHSISTFETFLYTTDSFQGSVLRIEKFNGSSVKAFTSSEFARAPTLRVYHRQRQPNVQHPCQNNNGGCEHLCIIDYNNENLAVAKCICRDGYKMGADKRCQSAFEPPFLIIGKTRPGTIKGLPLIANSSYFSIVPIRGLRRPTALALVMKSHEIIFTDSSAFNIQKLKISNDNPSSRQRETIIESGNH